MEGAVKVKLGDKEFEAPAGITVREAIEHLGLAPETVVATLEGKLVHDRQVLQAGQRIRLIRIVSGG